MDKAKIAKLCNDIEDEVTDIAFNSTHYHISDCCEAIREYLKEIAAEISEPPKSNDEHTAAYWMQKTMDAAHEAYDRLKDTVDFKNAIAEVEALKQRMGITEQKKKTNADRIRQMTDEELEEFLHKLQMKVPLYGYYRQDAMLEWLKQEVKD